MSTMYRDIMKAEHRLGDVATFISVQRHRIADLSLPRDASDKLADAYALIAKARALIQEAADAMPATVAAEPMPAHALAAE